MHRSVPKSVMARIRCCGGRGRSVLATTSSSAASARLGSSLDAVTTTTTSSSSPPSIASASITTAPPGGSDEWRRYHQNTHRLKHNSHNNHHNWSVTTSRWSPVVFGRGRRYHPSARSPASASAAVAVDGGGGSTEANATGNSSPPPSPSTSDTTITMDDHRRTILESSLAHVPEHGWTEDALAAGVASSGLPPSTIGLVTGKGSDLVSYFMDKCNEDLRRDLDEISPIWDDEGLTVAERIRRSLRIRLEMVGPYVKCDRWHEAMAIGAQLLPYDNNAPRTAAQLEEMVGIVAERGCPGVHMGVVERTAIGGAYVATELHMLADTSDGFVDTWTFLGGRVDDLEWMANNASGGFSGVANGDLALAASAVATSLGGAVLSLVQPAGAGVTSALASSALFPRMATFMRAEDETASPAGAAKKSTAATDEDFGDLPPFETDVDRAAGIRRK